MKNNEEPGGLGKDKFINFTSFKNMIKKPDELLFLEKYEKAKQEIRKTIEFIDFIKGIKNSQTRKYLREIEIIQEAFQKAVYD